MAAKRTAAPIPACPWTFHQGRRMLATMVDFMTPVERSERMSRIKGKDTRPELLVRKALHAQGFRFRLNVTGLPGRPDIVMRKYAAVVFVHGCYWHFHRCQKGRVPGSNPLFWKDKFLSNKRRDARNARALHAVHPLCQRGALRGADREDSAIGGLPGVPRGAACR